MNAIFVLLALGQLPSTKLLCIGIDYRGTGKQELAGPADAQLFRSAMETHFDASGSTLLNPGRTEIIGALRSAIRSTPAGGQLIIYYSGHGAQIPDSGRSSGFRQALVPKDFRLKQGGLDPASLIDGPQIGSILEEGSALRQIIVVADACHSTALTRGKLIAKSLSVDALSSNSNRPTFEFGKLANVTVLAACQSHQKAYQLNGNAVFTRALVGALSDLRRLKTAEITTWGDLIAETRARIAWEISGAKISADAQIPQLEGRLDQAAFGTNFREPDDKFPVVATGGRWLFQAGRAQGIEVGNLVEVKDPQGKVVGSFAVTEAGITESKLEGTPVTSVGLRGEVVDRTPDNRVTVQIEVANTNRAAIIKALTDPALPRLFEVKASEATFIVRGNLNQWEIFGEDLAAPIAKCPPDPVVLRRTLIAQSRVRAFQRLQSPPNAQVVISLVAVPLSTGVVPKGNTTLDLSLNDRFLLKLVARYADGTAQDNIALAQRDGRYIYLHSVMPSGEVSPLWPVYQPRPNVFRFSLTDTNVNKIVPDGKWRWVGSGGFLLTETADGKPVPLEMETVTTPDRTLAIPRLPGVPNGRLATMRFDTDPGGVGQFETVKLLATSTPVDANQWLDPAVTRSVSSHRLMGLLESFTDGRPRSRTVGLGDWAVAEVRIHLKP
jgi:hypothetical protein